MDFFSSSEEDASFEPFAHNLPILLALAHRNNITKDSSFYKVMASKYPLHYKQVWFSLAPVAKQIFFCLADAYSCSLPGHISGVCNV